MREEGESADRRAEREAGPREAKTPDRGACASGVWRRLHGAWVACASHTRRPTAGHPRAQYPTAGRPRAGPHARLQLGHRLGMECASGLDEGPLSSRSLHWAPAVGSEERMKTHHREAAPSPGAQGQGRGFRPAGRPSERRAPALPQPRPLLSSQGRPLKLKRPCTDSKFQATASSTHQDSPRRMASRRCSPISRHPEGSHLTSRDWRLPASLDV